MVLYRLGANIAGVFLPFVILQAGGELWMVAAYYLVYATVKIICNYPFMRINQARGPHVGMGFGYLFGAMQLIAILSYVATTNPIFLVFGSVGLALLNSFTWTAQHLFISQVIDGKTKSSSIATIEIFGRLSDVVGPIIGGLVGAAFGSVWVLVLAIACIGCTAFPLRRMGRITLPKGQPTVRYSLSGAPPRDLAANFFWNLETSIGMMLWPIYLAVALAGYRSIGWAAAVAALAAAVVTWAAGKRGDSGKDRSVLVTGAVATSFVDLLRLWLASPLGVISVGMLYRSSVAYLQNAWTSTYYGNAKKRGPQYIMSMEIVCDLAYLLVWGSLLAVLVSSGSPDVFFRAAFLIAACAALGTLFLSDAHNARKHIPR